MISQPSPSPWPTGLSAAEIVEAGETIGWIISATTLLLIILFACIVIIGVYLIAGRGD